MRIINQAREELAQCRASAEGSLARAEARVLSLEKSIEGTARELPALGAELQRGAQRLSEALERAEAQAARVAASLSGDQISAAAGDIADFERAARGRAQPLMEASQQAVDGAEALVRELTGATSLAGDCARVIASARQSLADSTRRGTEVAGRVEKQLVELRQGLNRALDEVQTAAVAGLQKLQASTAAFVDEIKGLLDGIENAVRAATAPIAEGAEALQRLVTDVITKAADLIETIQGLATTVLSAIDKVPVSSLPEPMAKPAVSTLTQVASEFATQLQAGAKAASSQLEAASTQISSSIESAQAKLSEQLETALAPLREEVGKLVARIREQQAKLQEQIASALAELERRRDAFLERARDQIEKLTAPASKLLAELSEQVRAAAEQATDAIASPLEQAAARVEQLGELSGRSRESLTTLIDRVEREVTEVGRQSLELRQRWPGP